MIRGVDVQTTSCRNNCKASSRACWFHHPFERSYPKMKLDVAQKKIRQSFEEL